MAATATVLSADTLMMVNQTAGSELMDSEMINGNEGTLVAKLTGSDFEYFIHGDKTVIGRNSSHGQVDVSIGLSSYVSRKHLQISKERDRYFLKCLGKNGVFVNGQFQRLGADPYPLEPNCMIRFPSTNIKLQFSFVKQSLDSIRSNGKHEESLERVEADKRVNKKFLSNQAQQLCLPESEETIRAEIQAVQRVSPPIAKPFVPVRDVAPTAYINPFVTKPFFSAPPSPTGTISAANSCPASPKGDNSHMNITDNLKMAAAYAAKVVQERADNPDGNHGNESPPRDDLKPPYSYAQLIIQAIASSKNKHLTLSGIYAHITKHYPYYRTADKGWQNSIRHNLSLNRYFVKVPRSQDESGKGSFWRIEPASENKLVEQAWRKRRQRGVPCFRPPISSLSAARSAPASPVHSNPISPQSQQGSQESQSSQPVPISHQHAHSQPFDKEPKSQFLQTTRYSQSSPGSPATLSSMVVSTTTPVVVNNQPVIAPLHQPQNPGLFNPKPAVGKVIWPLDVTKPPAAFTAPHVMSAVPSNDVITSEGVIRAANVTDPQKLSIVVPQPQQVVMVTGQQPVVSLGTIINPTNVSLSRMPQGAAVIMKRPFPSHPANSIEDDTKKKLKIQETGDSNEQGPTIKAEGQ